MTDRQTIIDLFEKHADWHDDLAWIEVGCAADLIVDLEDKPRYDAFPHPVLSALMAAYAFRPTEDELSGEDG